MNLTWAAVEALVALYSCISLFNPFRCLSCRRGLCGQAVVDPVAQPRRVRQAGHCDEGKNNSVKDYEDLCCSYSSQYFNQTSRHVKLLGTGSGTAIWMRFWTKENYRGAQNRGNLENVRLWSECFFWCLEFLQAGLRRNKRRFLIKSRSAFQDFQWHFQYCGSASLSDADPDLAFLLNAVMDPAFHFNVDPYPDSLQGDASLSPLVYRFTRATFWAFMLQLWASVALHGSILSFQSSWILT